MSEISNTAVDEFAEAARRFCSWATSPVDSEEQEAAAALKHLADLLAAGCGLGWDEREPADFDPPVPGAELVKAKASALPFQYYSEIFNNLVVPPEEGVVGDLVDDLVDIYQDVAPGLEFYDAGRRDEARNHWQFWFASHWGEHATSASRALWSYLVGRVSREL